MQELLRSTLSKDIHLPSAEKLWQIPNERALPIEPGAPARSTPLEVHATSYLAASDKIVSFFKSSIPLPLVFLQQITLHYNAYILRLQDGIIAKYCDIVS